MTLAIVVKCDWPVGGMIKHVFKKLPVSSHFLFNMDLLISTNEQTRTL